jgi:hypothetical protein
MPLVKGSRGKRLKGLSLERVCFKEVTFAGIFWCLAATAITGY